MTMRMTVPISIGALSQAPRTLSTPKSTRSQDIGLLQSSLEWSSRVPAPPADEKPLTAAIIRLAQQYGRYGYRRITALLRNESWLVNAKRVERIWRREGLKVPQRQPKRGRLWFNDGSCVRLRPQYSGHVWSYDFVMDRTHDGKAFRMLNIIDEFTRESLAIHVRRKLNSQDVLHVLGRLFLRHGPPEHIRSDNGPEFVAHAVRD